MARTSAGEASASGTVRWSALRSRSICLIISGSREIAKVDANHAYDAMTAIRLGRLIIAKIPEYKVCAVAAAVEAMT